jgi:hypothetical protein
MSNESKSIVHTRCAGVTLLLLLPLIPVAWCLYSIYLAKCIDGCGPYHYTTSVADLDGDGDLDLLLSGLRHESETIFWAGSILWINQGRENFIPRKVDYGGPSAAVGDVDGDGDIDVVRLDYRATLFLNQGGEQGNTPGDFRQWQSIAPQNYRHDYSSLGTVVLADLNNDGQLDVLVSYCCSTVVDKRDDFLPFLPWVWINTPDEAGSLKGQASYLTSLGDLPMRPTLGDLDGDGYLDIYAASLPPKRGNYDSSDRILLNDGSGAFVDSGQRLDNPRKAGAAGSGAVALGDLDSDSDLDAMVATAKGASIWINQGGAQGGQTGIFAESGQRLGRGHIEAVFLADLDANGYLDALVDEKAPATFWWNLALSVAGRSRQPVAANVQATIWWNDGQGEFRRSELVFPYREDASIAVADFDGDGDQDIFIGRNQDDYQVWFNDGKRSFKVNNP